MNNILKGFFIGFFMLYLIVIYMKHGKEPTTEKVVVQVYGIEDRVSLESMELNDVEEFGKEDKNNIIKPYPEMSGSKKTLAPPHIFLRGELVNLHDSELRCMAMNVYFEGRNRSTAMQEAIAWTTLGRVGSFGNKTICDTVTNARKTSTGHLVDGKCHFSWYCDASKTEVWDGEEVTVLHVAENAIEDKAYRKAVKIAMRVMESHRLHGFKYSPVGKATHYHRDDVNPYWKTSMTFIKKYDDHIFYKG